MSEQYISPERSRILFVDPADAFSVTDKDGKTINMSPAYEDMCISFDLIVENYPRMKSSAPAEGDSDENVKRSVISWYSENSKSSFMRGNSFGTEGGQSYLTTYYTDISYDEYGEQKFNSSRQIVEGLGVENVTINFESWMCPTATIKFVDVRGSAIFGNEEAIHNEKGEITAENIFGCFMTMPYPKFRLQVKGFMGRPVTFQLTCSSFNGEYNSQNGNFEITVKFIGYTYSLLTDVPFEYLMLAPFSNYVGAEYWSEKCGTKEWRLDNGSEPPKLRNLIATIESERTKDLADADTQKSVSPIDNDRLNTLSGMRTSLVAIKNSLNNFVTAFVDCCTENKFSLRNNDADGNTQVVLFLGTENIILNNSVLDLYAQFLTNVDNYNNEYATTKLTYEIYPNQWKDAAPSSITGKKVFIIERTGDQITDVKFVQTSSNVSKFVMPTEDLLLKCKLNDNRTLNADNAKALQRCVTKGLYDNRVTDFIYILDLYNLSSVIEDKIKWVDNMKSATKRKIQDKFNTQLEKAIGFKPTIGNIFRIIMCHLETFIHMFIELGNSIMAQANKGLRSPSVLNISVNDTDVYAGNNKLSGAPDVIPPWPIVVNRDNISGDKLSEIAWIGDKSPNFLEEQMVVSFEQTISKPALPLNETGTDFETSEYIPLLSNDYQYEPYRNVYDNNTDYSSIIAMVITRAMQLFGMQYDMDNLNECDIKDIAKLEVYNLCRQSVKPNEIKNRILDKCGGSFTDWALDIAQAKHTAERQGETMQNGNKKYQFETRKRKGKNGDPIITEDGSDYIYDRWAANNKIYLMPTRIQDFQQFMTVFNWDDATDVSKPVLTYTGPQYVTKDWLSLAATEKIEFGDNAAENAKILKTPIKNSYLCNIITEQSQIDKIFSICTSLIEGGSKKVGDTDFDVSLTDNNLPFKLYCNKNDVLKFYDDSDFIINPKQYKDSNTGIYLSDAAMPEGDIVERAKGTFVVSPGFERGDWVGNDGKTESYKPCHMSVVTRENNIMCVFGTGFYYGIFRQGVGEDKNDAYNRAQRAKALFFLHTMVKQRIDLNLFNKSKSTIDYCPYYYLLFLGGLLWRSDFRVKNGFDPICGHTEVNGKVIGTGNWDSHESAIFEENGKILEKTYLYYDGNHMMARLISKGKIDAPVCENVASFFGYGKNSDKIYGQDWWPEKSIADQLIGLFEEFVTNGLWIDIQNTYELHSIESRDGVTNRTTRYEVKSEFDYDVRLLGNGLYSTTSKNCLIKKSEYKARIGRIFTNWQGKYNAIWPDKGCENLNMLCDPNHEMQDSIKNELYLKKVMVVNGCYRSISGMYNGDYRISVSKNNLRTYLDEFGRLLTGLASAVEGNNSEGPVDNQQEPLVDARRDMRLSLYLSMKNLWDKWILSASEREYDVKNFFNDNFVFMDSYYMNMYDKLTVNLQVFYDIVTQSPKEKSLYNVIDLLTAKHNCIFMSVPDYVGFSTTQQPKTEAMIDMFRPIPYNNMEPMRDNNKFVVIYTYGGSHTMPGDTNYKTDSFDIWSVKEGVDAAPLIYKVNSLNQDETTKYGYYVPSFAVAMNTQYNSIFKSIKVNMNNPVLTEASVKITESIIETGKDKDRKFAYCGQDLYPIYSNYAYECEVEMLGNAQIAPLMYFQLLNVPMWRGTYMIYNVSHTMTPGNMVTKFKGSRMSNRCVPFVKSMYSFINDNNFVYSYGTTGKGAAGGIFDNVTLQSSYQKADTPSDDHFNNRKEFRRGGLNEEGGQKYNTMLQTVFNSLVEEIRLLDENRSMNNGKGKWNICVTSVVRHGSDDNTGSAHYDGNAMDIHVLRYDSNGNGTACTNGTLQPELFTVLDLICKNHRQQVGRVLVEYPSATSFSGGNPYNLQMLHIEAQSTNPPCYTRLTPWIMCYNGSKKYGSIDHMLKTNKSSVDCPFLKGLPPAFRAIAAADYWNNPSSFKTMYPNFGNVGYSDSVLQEYFGKHRPTSNSGGSAPYDPTAPASDIFGLDYMCKKNNASQSECKAALDELQKETGINPNIFMMMGFLESSLDKNALSETGAMGLFQVLPSTFKEAKTVASRAKHTNLQHIVNECGSETDIRKLPIKTQIGISTLMFVEILTDDKRTVNGSDVNNPWEMHACNAAWQNAIYLKKSKNLDGVCDTRAMRGGSASGKLRTFYDYFLRRKQEVLKSKDFSDHDKQLIQQFV